MTQLPMRITSEEPGLNPVNCDSIEHFYYKCNKRKKEPVLIPYDKLRYNLLLLKLLQNPTYLIASIKLCI